MRVWCVCVCVCVTWALAPPHGRIRLQHALRLQRARERGRDRGRGRGRDSDRDSDRDTDRKTRQRRRQDGDGDRDRDRETETETETRTRADTQRQRQRDRGADGTRSSLKRSAVAASTHRLPVPYAISVLQIAQRIDSIRHLSTALRTANRLQTPSQYRASHRQYAIHTLSQYGISQAATWGDRSGDLISSAQNSRGQWGQLTCTPQNQIQETAFSCTLSQYRTCSSPIRYLSTARADTTYTLSQYCTWGSGGHTDEVTLY
eukprot:2936961-Rhodomonas_salina.1